MSQHTNRIAGSFFCANNEILKYQIKIKKYPNFDRFFDR